MIAINIQVNKPIEVVWDYWTNPEHIIHWNSASDDWWCPKAENDLKVGGKFNYTLASKDGDNSFDFSGTYSSINKNKSIEYVIFDDRKVVITFEDNKDSIIITESFEPENMNSLELQKDGWQAILNHFKEYTETN